MYAEWTVIKVKPEYQEETPKMTAQFAAMHESLKGFKSQIFVMDEESGEGGCLSLWETKEDLDAAVAACLPPLQQAAGMLKEEPTLKVYKVTHMSQK